MITAARLGPASAIRRKKTRNASAEHTSPSTTTDDTASNDGADAGMSPMPNGSSMIAAIPRAAVTGPSGSAPDSLFFTISGPTAYPTVANSTAAAPISSEPLPPRSMPTSAATPARPISMPSRRVAVGRSLASKRSASAATTSGSAAIRIAVSDEGIRCSPKPISGNGIAISVAANRTSHLRGSPRSAPLRSATGSSTSAASVTRDHAMNPGVRPASTAILMKR